MKAKRIVPLAAAFTCVLFVLAFVFIITSDVRHPWSEGQRLSIQELGPDEEIIVSTLFAHHSAQGREYSIRSVGTRRTVAIFDTRPELSGQDEKKGGVLLFSRDLSDAEIRGLDEVIAYCREVREEMSSAEQHIHLRYFRDRKAIGEEFYIGLSLPSRLSYLVQGKMTGEPASASDYEILADQFGVSVQRLHRMIPFEMLEKEEPNRQE